MPAHRYKDGTEAVIGDVVIAPWYGRAGHAIGVVLEIKDAAQLHDLVLDVALSVMGDTAHRRRHTTKLPQSHIASATAADCERVI